MHILCIYPIFCTHMTFDARALSLFIYTHIHIYISIYISIDISIYIYVYKDLWKKERTCAPPHLLRAHDCRRSLQPAAGAASEIVLLC